MAWEKGLETNRADPDQTAPFRSSLIRIHNVCAGLGEIHVQQGNNFV